MSITRIEPGDRVSIKVSPDSPHYHSVQDSLNGKQGTVRRSRIDEKCPWWVSIEDEGRDVGPFAAGELIVLPW